MKGLLRCGKRRWRAGLNAGAAAGRVDELVVAGRVGRGREIARRGNGRVEVARCRDRERVQLRDGARDAAEPRGLGGGSAEVGHDGRENQRGREPSFIG